MADIFQVSYTGGANGTQLGSLTINLDNTFFNTENAAPGVYGWFPLTILNHDGFQITSTSVVNGGTQLLMNFSGFTAGMKLVFTVDVDENGNLEPNAVVEGAELEGATLSAAFTAPHMQDIAASGAIFYDQFAKHYPDFAASDVSALLPNDDYDNQPALDYMPGQCSPGPVYTALAYSTVTQKPLPITLSGTVYEDLDVDNVHDSGEPGIAGVSSDAAAIGQRRLRLDRADRHDRRQRQLQFQQPCPRHLPSRGDAARRLFERRRHAGHGQRRHPRRGDDRRYSQRHQPRRRRRQHPQRFRRGETGQPQRPRLRRRQQQRPFRLRAKRRLAE